MAVDQCAGGQGRCELLADRTAIHGEKWGTHAFMRWLLHCVHFAPERLGTRHNSPHFCCRLRDDCEECSLGSLDLAGWLAACLPPSLLARARSLYLLSALSISLSRVLYCSTSCSVRYIKPLEITRMPTTTASGCRFVRWVRKHGTFGLKQASFCSHSTLSAPI